MKTCLSLLTSALLLRLTSAQIVSFTKDGTFESVPKASTDKQDVSAGDWLVQNNAVFAYNPRQPKGYTTPYGAKFVYYANNAINDTNGEVGHSVTVPKNTNLTIRYDYRVFQNANAECRFAVTFNDQVVDAFVLPTDRVKWTARGTKLFQSSVTTGAYAFSVGCEQQSKLKLWRFGLDNVELLYEGCPACG